ncbi:MAG: MHYT domain-containing protein [Brevundimonas sp.]|uniref:MHYT domain-containing protein n=1 Tax=Brevundimonas sp. TaxID=1871086 RepID=UPI00391D63B7
MHHHHPVLFVVLSLAVAIGGAWTALELFQRTRTDTRERRMVWVGVASTAMGLSIWSMHFIAMLGFDVGVPLDYDPGLTAFSLVVAIVGTAGAFFAVSSGQGALRLVTAGAAMGLSIWTMHYVGMAAIRMVQLRHDPVWMMLAFAVAVSASTAALWAAPRQTSSAWRMAAAGLMGLAIAGMHYTAMIGVTAASADPSGATGGGSAAFLAVSLAAVTAVALLGALAASLHDQRQRLLEVLDAGGVGHWEMHPSTGAVQASARARTLMGLPLGTLLSDQEWADRMSNGSRRERAALVARLLEEGGDYSAEYQLLDERWVGLRGRVHRGRSRRTLKISGIITDLTDQRAAFEAVAASEQRQRVLINELNHRVKNTLASIQSIARLTARRSPDLSSFLSAFEARLQALSNTQNLLTAQSWTRAEIGALLASELAPYAKEQAMLKGPEVWVNAEQGLSLGLVFHELTTNAAKHGALSTPDGCVEVDWQTMDGRIVMRWAERGGPKVSPPSRQGFGSQLIRSSIERTLGGELSIDYVPTGVRYSLSFELAAPTG